MPVSPPWDQRRLRAQSGPRFRPRCQSSPGSEGWTPCRHRCRTPDSSWTKITSLCIYICLLLWNHWLMLFTIKNIVPLMPYGRQWWGIFHYHWWTTTIKPRVLFSPCKRCFLKTFIFFQINIKLERCSTKQYCRQCRLDQVPKHYTRTNTKHELFFFYIFIFFCNL